MFNFSKLITVLYSGTYVCNNCCQEYDIKWYNREATRCFFCLTFMPMRDTYSSILKDIEWYYTKSGENDRKEYYKQYIKNLQKWSNRFHVFPTKADLKHQNEILTSEFYEV
jgi:hypothetical protein